MNAPGAIETSTNVYEALENYNWDDDVEFQSGLSAILGSNSTPEQATELTLRARCFYYARKYNVNLDFDAYKAYRTSRPSRPIAPPNGVQAASASASAEAPGSVLPASSTNPNDPPAPYPVSFAHIVELVTTGQPIPGIKEIPNTILTGQGTEAVKEKRKKPWERGGSVSSGPGS
ncbi:uncharacterized protein BDR25DRAFT_261000 [Lindgomyces ingoldianus]|uniref:Uncharacterized protein n=1 Tax=Lindgomyces ingoldianus TaxID=673940 RepID=A0ACB6QZB3_9PLEO|nr:uncharacterized protein BDR25DRAFT_261000 [Lindgomyces ingoldianus]KAF2471442.1 hypothetical protein BDR25DRAFT_261000 [Lindgomyces ingoldianus]